MIIPSFKHGIIASSFPIPVVSAVAGITFYEIIELTTIGNVSYTLPTNIAYVEMELLGGGGGGAKSNGFVSGRATVPAGGGGGGGGGYVKYIYGGTYSSSLAPNNLQAGDILHFTVGYAGTGADSIPENSSTGVNGAAGGTSSWDGHERSSTTYTPASTIAGGGGGGGFFRTTSTGTATGGYGGLALGGDVNLQGITGLTGGPFFTTYSEGGTGGSGGSHITSGALGENWSGGSGGYIFSTNASRGFTGQTGGGGGGGAGSRPANSYRWGATGGQGMIKLKVYVYE